MCLRFGQGPRPDSQQNVDCESDDALRPSLPPSVSRSTVSSPRAEETQGKRGLRRNICSRQKLKHRRRRRIGVRFSRSAGRCCPAQGSPQTCGKGGTAAEAGFPPHRLAIAHLACGHRARNVGQSGRLHHPSRSWCMLVSQRHAKWGYC